MNSKDLKKKLIKLINQRTPSLIDLHNTVKEFSNKKGKKEEALIIVEEIRNLVQDEKKDDLLLELTDFISGFCPPPLKIWSK